MADPDDRRVLLIRHPIAVGFALFVLLGALHVLAQAAGVLLLGFLAVLVGTLLSYPIDFFSRFAPRPIALLLTVVLLVVFLVGLGLLTAPVVSAQAARLGEQIPAAIDRLRAFWDGLTRSGAVPEVPGPSLAGRLAAEIEELLRRALPFAMSVGSAVFTGVLLLVLALFLAYAPDTYRGAVRALVPRDHEPLFDEAWGRLGTTLRRWTGGIFIEMLTMGVLASIGLAIAGIDGWLLLGVLTFLGTFVPYVGAVASAIPALLVGLAESPTKFLYVLAVYTVVHLVEGYVVSPYIMRRAVLLRPGLLVYWQLLAGTLFGLPGIFVATPLLACAKVAVDYFWIERRLGKEPETG